MKKSNIQEALKNDNIRFLRLQFSDVMGMNKNVEVPESQFEKALDGQILFDGSSIEGFARIEESDMLLKPDYSTYVVMPWDEPGGRVARLICDVCNPDGSPFGGCPRLTLKRMVNRAKDLGYTMMVGPEAEFFLFHRDVNGKATTSTHDAGGYFDLTPIDRGEEARRAIVNALEMMDFEVEAAHHEVAPAQHEVDFRYADALIAADNIATFRFVVRKIALDYNCHATFMPKPIYGINGSGMHINLSLFSEGKNIFNAPEAEYGLSKTALSFIAGILSHARGMSAVTNPLINSYKRLVPGYEAPTHIAWSERNRSPLCRVPARRGSSTRVEYRAPDPSCNPYLALAVMLAAGLDGMEKDLDPGAPVNKNFYTMSKRERGRLKIASLPANLKEALDLMGKDKLVREALGEHIFLNFLHAKNQEWGEYIAQVHEWELARYLATY